MSSQHALPKSRHHHDTCTQTTITAPPSSPHAVLPPLPPFPSHAIRQSCRSLAIPIVLPCPCPLLLFMLSHATSSSPSPPLHAVLAVLPWHVCLSHVQHLYSSIINEIHFINKITMTILRGSGEGLERLQDAGNTC